MSKESSSVSSGIGLGGMVFLVFLVLKLTGTGMVANWSWWWVTCPLWIIWAILLGIGIIWLFFTGLFMLIEWITWKVGKYRKVKLETKKMIDKMRKSDSK